MEESDCYVLSSTKLHIKTQKFSLLFINWIIFKVNLNKNCMWYRRQFWNYFYIEVLIHVLLYLFIIDFKPMVTCAYSILLKYKVTVNTCIVDVISEYVCIIMLHKMYRARAIQKRLPCYRIIVYANIFVWSL